MIVLPAILPQTKKRPDRPEFEESYLIPDLDQYHNFWSPVYEAIRDMNIASPVENPIQEKINPVFGYFGYRVHPVKRTAKYFHTGLSLDLESGTEIKSVLPGVLEYSGYGAVNGYYVLLSHPQIQTEDGYVLHTMYCHLKKPAVKFNSYQKMLREISLGSYPIVEIDNQTVLGTASTSGMSRENKPGMYLQFSFRKFDKTNIAINPLPCYIDDHGENNSSNITDQAEIDILFPSLS